MFDVEKLEFGITLIFKIYIKGLDELFLNKFITVLLALVPLLSTTLLLSSLNTLKVKFNNSIIFNKGISYATILINL